MLNARVKKLLLFRLRLDLLQIINLMKAFVNFKANETSTNCSCNEPWTQTKYGCYFKNSFSCKKIKGETKSGCNWFQARHLCKKNGGYLAEITSLEEQNAIMESLYSDSNVKDNPFWLGLSLDEVTNDFVFTKNEKKPIYMPWCVDSPREISENKCVFLRVRYSRDKESNVTKLRRCWDNASCHVLRLPLCEKDIQKTQHEEKCLQDKTNSNETSNKDQVQTGASETADNNNSSNLKDHEPKDSSLKMEEKDSEDEVEVATTTNKDKNEMDLKGTEGNIQVTDVEEVATSKPEAGQQTEEEEKTEKKEAIKDQSDTDENEESKEDSQTEKNDNEDEQPQNKSSKKVSENSVFNHSVFGKVNEDDGNDGDDDEDTDDENDAKVPEVTTEKTKVTIEKGESEVGEKKFVTDIYTKLPFTIEEQKKPLDNLHNSNPNDAKDPKVTNEITTVTLVDKSETEVGERKTDASYTKTPFTNEQETTIENIQNSTPKYQSNSADSIGTNQPQILQISSLEKTIDDFHKFAENLTRETITEEKTSTESTQIESQGFKIETLSTSTEGNKKELDINIGSFEKDIEEQKPMNGTEKEEHEKLKIEELKVVSISDNFLSTSMPLYSLNSTKNSEDLNIPIQVQNISSYNIEHSAVDIAVDIYKNQTETTSHEKDVGNAHKKASLELSQPSLSNGGEKENSGEKVRPTVSKEITSILSSHLETPITVTLGYEMSSSSGNEPTKHQFESFDKPLTKNPSSSYDTTPPMTSSESEIEHAKPFSRSAESKVPTEPLHVNHKPFVPDWTKKENDWQKRGETRPSQQVKWKDSSWEKSAFLDIHQFWKNVPKAPGYEEFQNSHKKYTSNEQKNIAKILDQVCDLLQAALVWPQMDVGTLRVDTLFVAIPAIAFVMTVNHAG